MNNCVDCGRKCEYKLCDECYYKWASSTVSPHQLPKEKTIEKEPSKKPLLVYKAYKDEYPLGSGGVLRSWRGNKLKGKIWTGKGALKAAFSCWVEENELDEIVVEEYELVLKRCVLAREIVEE